MSCLHWADPLAASTHRPSHLILSRRQCPAFAGARLGACNQDCHRQAGARERKQRHEESLAGVLPASGRLRGEEAAGCRDPASHTEPAATTHCRTHRTLRSGQAGKCQHGDLQLSGSNHRDRFKNRAHHVSLQENERGTMRPGLESGSSIFGHAGHAHGRLPILTGMFSFHPTQNHFSPRQNSAIL
jgi:hypothetical protein